MVTQIKFSITPRKNEYFKMRLDDFLLGIENIDPKELGSRYEQFINNLLAGKINKSTLIDVDVLELFAGSRSFSKVAELFADDLEHHAMLDDEWEKPRDLQKGAKEFSKLSHELQVHLQDIVEGYWT